MADHETGYVLCEECGVNAACYTISVMMAGQVKQRHLCPEYMAKMNMSIATGNIRQLLSAIMTAITGTQAPAAGGAGAEAVEDIVCPRCDTALSQFTKSGRLGCPGCYEAFRAQLMPMLQQIHGRVQHAGRKPLDTEEAQRSRSMHETLQRQMEEAVAAEDFEKAAQLRDQLRALAEGEANA